MSTPDGDNILLGAKLSGEQEAMKSNEDKLGTGNNVPTAWLLPAEYYLS